MRFHSKCFFCSSVNNAIDLSDEECGNLSICVQRVPQTDQVHSVWMHHHRLLLSIVVVLLVLAQNVRHKCV